MIPPLISEDGSVIDYWPKHISMGTASLFVNYDATRSMFNLKQGVQLLEGVYPIQVKFEDPSSVTTISIMFNLEIVNC